MAYDSLVLANEFIRLRPPILTPMKLQKLIYFAHGWRLALSGNPLVTESFEAWTYGPVLPSVYRAFRKYGGSIIVDPVPETGVVSEQVRPLILKILSTYGNHSGLALSNLTHRPSSAWSIANYLSPGSLIDNDLIKQDFLAVLCGN